MQNVFKRVSKKLIILCLMLSFIVLPTQVFAHNVTNDSNVTLIDVENKSIEEIAESLGIDPSKIVSYGTYRFDDECKSQISPQSIFGVYPSVTSRGEVWGAYPISTDYVTGGPGGTTFKHTYTHTESMTQTNTLGISAYDISLGLSYGGTTTFQLTKEVSTIIPPNTNCYINIHVIYDSYTFDLVDPWDGSIDGYGSARVPKGLAYLVVED